MSNRILKTAVLLAFSTLSALAVAADDPPARVGRVALTQGQVSIGGDVGAEMNPAQVNWPVTSGNTISTAPGARTELRVGSTSIRLDGDSSLEVTELDDDSIRLRLHYGSASVRVVNADVLRGFELVTPQLRVRLQEPGRVRIDAERVRDTSAVNVFDGAALVESGPSQLTVRAGKRLEATDDDVRTASAVQDAFDSWSASRDRLADKATSARYTTTEMTGYEDLDRYGSWRNDSEYGPLWIPTVASDWVPYRDGSWTWIEPWGWTWVDNAPWGYAPFHYGRWVQVNRRWAWAPGSRAERVVWAPALVGWVGGAGWNITFHDRSRRPGFGWYPLSPHERYVPSWHASDRHLGWLNHHVRPNPHRGRDFRPQGVTVVPQDRFGAGGRVNVPKTPVATVPPSLVQNGIPVVSAPPAPPNRPHRGRDGGPGRPDRLEGRMDRVHDRDRNGRPDRPDRIETARVDQDGFVRQRPVQQQPLPASVAAQGVTVTSPPPRAVPPGAQGLPVTSPPPQMPSPPQPATASSPLVLPPANQGWQRPDRPHREDRFERPDRQERQDRPERQERRDWDGDRREGREGRDGGDHRERRAAPSPSPAPVTMAAPAQPAQPAPVMMAPRPAPQPSAPPPMAAPAPAPVMRAAPPSPPAQPSPPPRAGVARAEERRQSVEDKGRQLER